MPTTLSFSIFYQLCLNTTNSSSSPHISPSTITRFRRYLQYFLIVNTASCLIHARHPPISLSLSDFSPETNCTLHFSHFCRISHATHLLKNNTRELKKRPTSETMQASCLKKQTAKPEMHWRNNSRRQGKLFFVAHRSICFKISH